MRAAAGVAIFVAASLAATIARAAPPSKPVWLRKDVRDLPGGAPDDAWVTLGASLGTLDAGGASATWSSFRFGGALFVGGPVYLGTDFELGSALDGPSGSVLRFGGVVGARLLHDEGTVSLRAEVMAGFRHVTIGGDRRAGVMVPRLAVDLWTAPTMSVQAWIGGDVLHMPEIVGGIGVAFFSRRTDR